MVGRRTMRRTEFIVLWVALGGHRLSSDSRAEVAQDFLMALLPVSLAGTRGSAEVADWAQDFVRELLLEGLPRGRGWKSAI